MAFGAATVVGRFNHDGRPAILDIISFTGDNAYAAGGTANFRAYVQQAVARGHLDIIAVIALKGPAVYYNRATDKLQVLASGGAEASGSQSGNTHELLVISN